MKKFILFIVLAVIITACGRPPVPANTSTSVSTNLAPDTIPTIYMDSLDYEQYSTKFEIYDNKVDVMSNTYNLMLDEHIESISATFDNGELVSLKINNKIFKQSETPIKDINLNNNVIVVKKGNTLIGISKAVGVPVETLKKLNNLSSSAIYSGQTLRINDETGSTARSSSTKH